MPCACSNLRTLLLVAVFLPINLTVLGQTYPEDEPYCYSMEDQQLLPNFIGSNGTDWWGPKSPQSTAPVSWIDRCAKQLEGCQQMTNVPQPGCVCEMWACLNPARGPPVARLPHCHWARQFLRRYYCDLAQQLGETCAGYPIPIPDACPQTRKGITFDTAAPGDLTYHGGFQWEAAQVMDSDNIAATGGPYNGTVSGMISRPNVLVSQPPALFVMRPDQSSTSSTMHLSSVYISGISDTVIDTVSFYAIGAQEETLGVYITPVYLTPRLLRFSAGNQPLDVAEYGSFASFAKLIVFSRYGREFFMDNMVMGLVGGKRVKATAPLDWSSLPSDVREMAQEANIKYNLNLSKNPAEQA